MKEAIEAWDLTKLMTDQSYRYYEKNFPLWMKEFDMQNYEKIAKEPIIKLIEKHYEIAKNIPEEYYKKGRGTESLIGFMLPWLKFVVRVLRLDEEMLRNEVLEERKGKEFDIKNYTFHLEGFTSTSFDRKVAEEFACKWPHPGRKHVIFEYDIKLDGTRYPGFQLNQKCYTAYPEENEFLLLDGADCIVKEVKDEFSQDWKC